MNVTVMTIVDTVAFLTGGNADHAARMPYTVPSHLQRGKNQRLSTTVVFRFSVFIAPQEWTLQ
jgi:hypothetical protein